MQYVATPFFPKSRFRQNPIDMVEEHALVQKFRTANFPFQCFLGLEVELRIQNVVIRSVCRNLDVAAPAQGSNWQNA